MNIYTEFRPTRLMIKRHIITGLRYFCKTVKDDVESYKGSGIVWNEHLGTHGREWVVNDWVSETFSDPNEIREFALSFSELFDIVNSGEWANSIPEDGIGKSFCGIPVKDSTGNRFIVRPDDARLASHELVHVNKGMIPVRDSDGNTLSVSVDDERLSRGELVHVTKNTVTVTNGISSFRVDINDPRYLSGELVGHTKGKVMVRDRDNNVMQVSTNDPKYLSGELVDVRTDRAVVIDKDGNRFSVSVNDERYLNGELSGANIGMIRAIDNQGNSVRVPKNDPRFDTGELSAWSKGYKHKTRPCCYCSREMSVTRIQQHERVCKSRL